METQELTLHNELKRKSIFLRDYTTELYASGGDDNPHREESWPDCRAVAHQG